MSRAKELFEDAARRGRETQALIAQTIELRRTAVRLGRSEDVRKLDRLRAAFVAIAERDTATRAMLSPHL